MLTFNYYHLNQLASQWDAMKNTIKEKNLLKKRYKIEHLNAKIKNNNRINLRKERNFQNYSSFLCLSFLQLYFDHINKTNNNEFLEYIERKYNI